MFCSAAVPAFDTGCHSLIIFVDCISLAVWQLGTAAVKVITGRYVYRWTHLVINSDLKVIVSL